MRRLELEPNAADQRSADRHMVLIVLQDGSICTVLQAPDQTEVGAVPELSGQSIETLWPGEWAERIKRYISRTIRSRQVQSEEFESAADESHYEFLFVPQGRDRVLVVVRDVSESKNAILKMQHLAYVDKTTTLPNREYLLEELRKCTDILRLKEGRAAVICFDIDHIDAQGNALGTQNQDSILKELAARLTHELRGANQPNPPDHERYSVVARIDFRRFGVVLPSVESGTDAESVTKRLAQSLQQPIKIGHRIVSVIARAGIALFPQDGIDAETLFDNAIVAMQDATNTGTTPYKFHTGTVKLRALQRQDMELELKTALDREEFTLKYLPIVEAATHKVVAVEALLRWPQTIFDAKSITKVVALAEHTGLIVPIGDWVLRRSCEQLKDWHQSGCAGLRLAVNLSVQEFSRRDLVQRLADVLESHSIEPEFLDLEITEHMLFRDAMQDYARCRELKQIGVGLVIDDYGTGACSLAHLSRSPVDAVKIDNSFVANCESSANDRAACAAVTALAHELGKKVVAEGVETDEQAELLHRQCCDFLQGFLFCQPTSASDIREYLELAFAGQEPADE